jgi:tripartite-type tricarboxylate transporter receptor subunit TctC
MRQSAILRVVLALAAAMLAVPLAHGEQAEPFFARKTITIYIGYTPGGSYDLYARLIARHIGKHIPGNPTVVPQNMPGAGSMKAANYIYQVAPRDGTALGVIVESAALEQVLGNAAVQYDAAKFIYVGRVSTSSNVFMQWHTSKVQSIEDSQKFESTLAGTGPGSIAETIPRLFNAIVGTKFKLISGYPASTEGMLAMERGEVEGASSSWAAVFVSKQSLLKEKKIKIILQTQPERHRDLPDTPSIAEYGNTPEDRQVTALYASGSGVGRSLIGPPEIPADRLKVLREAFDAMVKDDEFIADIRKLNVELDPLKGEQVHALIARTLAVPQTVRERAKLAFGR